MLRLSPSIIDSYEYFRDNEWSDPEQEAARLAELVAQIKGEKVPATRQMKRGTAFHAVLEDRPEPITVPGWDGPVLAATVDGFEFMFDAETADEVAQQLPRKLIREVPGTYLVAGVEIRFRVDGLHGCDVRELKTTESSIDTDKYMHAFQWRMYLLALSAKRCIYDVVKLRQDGATGVYTVAEYLPMSLWAYGRMRAEVERRVTECAQWVTSMGLAEFRQADAA